MLLQDLHGERACLHDGVLPREALRWLPTEGEAVDDWCPRARRGR